MDTGDWAAAIRVNLYRADPTMPSYPVGVVEPVIRQILEAGRREGLRQAAEVANTWGERSTTPGEKTIWHAIGESIGSEITALMGDEGS